MIGDILVKIAQKEPLSFFESQELSLWAKNRDESNKFISSIQDGTGTINVNRANGVNGMFRWHPRGLSSKIRFTATVPNTGNTAVTFTESVYDDIGGFVPSATTFNFNVRSWARIDIFCEWQTQSGGPRRLFNPSYDTTHSPYASPIINHFFYITAANGFSIAVAQHSAAQLTCSGTVRIQLVDKYVGIID